LNIIQETNNTIRETELKDTYELFESEYMEGFSLRHVLTKEEIKLTFDDKSAATQYAERRGWTLRK
jgi:hypothetical protein